MSAKRRLNSLRPKAFIYYVYYTLWRWSVISVFSWQSYWWLNFTHRRGEEQWILSNLNHSTWWKVLFCFENKYINQAYWRKQGVKSLRINENLVSFWFKLLRDESDKFELISALYYSHLTSEQSAINLRGWQSIFFL